VHLCRPVIIVVLQPIKWCSVLLENMSIGINSLECVYCESETLTLAENSPELFSTVDTEKNLTCRAVCLNYIDTKSKYIGVAQLYTAKPSVALCNVADAWRHRPVQVEPDADILTHPESWLSVCLSVLWTVCGRFPVIVTTAAAADPLRLASSVYTRTACPRSRCQCSTNEA